MRIFQEYFNILIIVIFSEDFPQDLPLIWMQVLRNLTCKLLCIDFFMKICKLYFVIERNEHQQTILGLCSFS